jgi:hypothetical protein
VGAEPWGLAFSRLNNNELIVANSFSTNLSIVDLTALSEIASRRIQTPNAYLFNVHEEISEAGGITYDIEPIIQGQLEFSDRPQFVEMDQNGRLVYSTLPTTAATPGTVRIAQLGPGATDRVQVTIFTDYALGVEGDGDYAVSNVCCASGGPSIQMSAYQPFTSRNNPPVPLFSSVYTVAGGTAQAVVELAADPGFPGSVPGIFRPRVRSGQRWVTENIALNDTTFVAASGTGNRIVIGEGDSAPTGRIMIWDAAALTASASVEVIDLVGNASERVLGVAMNHDGRLGVARGQLSAYFFDPDLRLI